MSSWPAGSATAASRRTSCVAFEQQRLGVVELGLDAMGQNTRPSLAAEGRQRQRPQEPL